MSSSMFTVELLQAQNRKLREENEELSETVRQLRAQMVDPDEVPAWFPYLTRVETAVWLSLQSGRLASRDQVMARIYGARPDDPPHDKIIDVYICKLRRKLPPEIIIDTVRGQGWRLSHETVDLLRRTAAPVAA